MSELPHNNIELYRRCMIRLKYRIDSVRALNEGHRSTGAIISNLEFAYLQIRKSLEGITLAGICTNRTAYEKMRPKLAKDWNANYIVRDLNRINPRWYPEPFDGFDRKPDGSRGFLPKKRQFLSHGEFLKICKRSAKFLHEDNPIAGHHNVDFEEEWGKIPSILDSIVDLLKLHLVHPSSEETWIVIMAKGSKQEVEVVPINLIGSA